MRRKKQHNKRAYALFWRIRLIALCLVLACPVMLTGCDATKEPENQAYAVIMSLDKTDAGMIEMGVTLPIISQEGSNSGGSSEGSEGGGASDHETFYMIANSFNEALDLLQATLPHSLNMTQLKLIVISQALAQEPSFHSIVESLMLTNHLYSTAYVLITLGTAMDFMNGLSLMPGQSFSAGISTAIQHYAMVGYVTDQTLATLYFLMNSIYGDPALILGNLNSITTDDRTLPHGEFGNALPGKTPREDGSTDEMMGCALFNHKHMVGVLTGSQTRWLTTLLGQINTFNYMSNGHYLKLMIKNKPGIRIDMSKSPIELTVTLNIQPMPIREMPDKRILRDQILAELSELFSHCQSLGVDPFGYAEHAAKQFLTIGEFEQFNWREKFQSAKVNFVINFVGSYL